MKPRVLLCLCMLVFYANDARSQTIDDRVALFTRYAAALQRQLGIPGVSAAVLQNDRIIWEGGFGVQDVEGRIPATAWTPYPIASLTKTFTSTLLLQCIDRGTLNLATPIILYTPAIPEPGATVGHVFTHTSQGTPGQSFHYDGDRYVALTAVAEACAGAPFRQLIAREILDRAGMLDSVPGQDLEISDLAATALFDPTTLARYRQVLGRIAKPYTIDSHGHAHRSPYPPKDLNAAAGLVATAHDLALYDMSLSAHLFVRAELQELAWTQGTTNSGATIPYGLGWFVQDIDGERVVWHYGLWGNAFSSLLLKVPERDLTLILLANSDGLTAKFRLAEGDVTRSPFATAFLRIVR